LALLNHSERRGFGPLELLWAVAGHPVPHNTFYLLIIDAESGRSVEYVLRKDVAEGAARILDWIS